MSFPLKKLSKGLNNRAANPGELSGRNPALLVDVIASDERLSLFPPTIITARPLVPPPALVTGFFRTVLCFGLPLNSLPALAPFSFFSLYLLEASLFFNFWAKEVFCLFFPLL